MAYLKNSYHQWQARDLVEAIHFDIKKKYPERLNLAEFSIPNGRRLDMISLDYLCRQVNGYEVKISRSDFKSDDKWTEYLPFCNKFYFVCPPDLIQPSELPKEIGLIYVEQGLVCEIYGEEVVKSQKKCMRVQLVRGARSGPEISDKAMEYIKSKTIFRAMDLYKLVEPNHRLFNEGYEHEYMKGLAELF